MKKSMVNLWMLDAATGIESYDNVEITIQELAKACFGGVDLALMSEDADNFNMELKVMELKVMELKVMELKDMELKVMELKVMELKVMELKVIDWRTSAW